jgi:hypothetical protein
VRARRAVVALISIAAVGLGSAPLASASGPVPQVSSAGSRWYEGKAGTVQWAIGSDFVTQLTDAGAAMTFCKAAKMSVISDVNVVTLPAHGNSIIELNGSQASFDGASDCAVTITGNGRTVTLTKLYFSVSAAYPSSMSATINDNYTDMASGAKKKLPKQANRSKITAVSPVLTIQAASADILRGQLDPQTGSYDGPVPTMTTDAVNVGLFQLTLKVKTTTRPVNPQNSEG